MIYLYKIICFLLTFLFVSCASNRHVEKQEVLNLDFIELTTPFEIIILDYNPAGCSCGVRSCASNTIGKTIIDNDTIRVLSLCNNDTTYQLGERVKVIPTEKPNFHVLIAQYWLNEDKKPYIPEIQKNTQKTIYGKLIKL